MIARFHLVDNRVCLDTEKRIPVAQFLSATVLI